MNFKEMIKAKERELVKKNVRELRANIDSSANKLKIENYANKYGVSRRKVRREIMKNNVVANLFAKDPYKQNFVENIVCEILGEKTLPISGKDSVRFTNSGKIISEKKPDATRAVDFQIGDTYITQKYTRNSGGMQDNQYKEVVDFLIKGSKKNKVAAILDGEYWDNRRTELKTFFMNNKNVKILSMDDIIIKGRKAF